MKRDERIQQIERLAQSSDANDILAIMRYGDDPSPYVRLKAMEELWLKDHPLARIIARALSRDANALLRSRAIDLLGEIGEKTDASIVIAATYDNDWAVRSSAADTLSQYQRSASKKALIRLVSCDENEIVRRDAALSLSLFGDPDAVSETLLENESSKQAKVGIVYALYHLFPGRYLGPFLSYLMDEDAVVRDVVVNTIRNFAIHKEDVPAIAHALSDMLNDEIHEGLREDAQASLASLQGHTSA